jgi:hypothetical protein
MNVILNSLAEEVLGGSLWSPSLIKSYKVCEQQVSVPLIFRAAGIARQI